MNVYKMEIIGTAGARRLQLTLLAGVLSRETALYSGYIFRKTTQLLKNYWQQCWATVKHDGFMYYYKKEEVDRL